MLNRPDLSQIFSSKRITELSFGDTRFIEAIASSFEAELAENFTISEVYDACYSTLSKTFRNEYFLKNIIIQKILLGKHSLNTATAITEFRVGKSKADCVIINGHSTCYEIKSNYDNLDRLHGQLSHYRMIFDKTYVVAEESQIEKLSKFDLGDAGLMQLTQRGTLKTLIEATTIRDAIDASTLIRSLRMNEYLELVKRIHGYKPDLCNTEIFFECERLMKAACPTKLRIEFCKVLKNSRKNDQHFLSALPDSLLAAGISYKLNKSQQNKLISTLNSQHRKDALCITQSLEANSLN
ncbi:sce7726 family protein [Pseudomonas sp. S37]|uniref:sce7726 family protein n=1 Tax=Pseudomonas sp. S37 TaxID=2767449 RepID=UPI001911BEDC|nr:sce7726 family protein [Pseudomonas sp. S37]MBK4994418.1 sce7726 family protein [Pseudomonas sp. S37]